MRDSDFRIFSENRAYSESEFKIELEKYTTLFNGHSRILLQASSPTRLTYSVLAASALRRDLFVCPPYISEDTKAWIISEYAIDLVVDDTKSSPKGTPRHGKTDGSAAHVYLFTSGTTGIPKIAEHTWDAVINSSGYVGERLAGRRWLMCYLPSSYAGLQVIFSSLANGGSLVFPGTSFESAARFASELGVEVISATPTYWKMLMNAWPSSLPRPRLLQATLGGELVTQEVLNLIAEFFQPERMTHIYASTEAGTAIVVSDGQAGFPLSMIEKKGGVELRIREGSLEVRSPRRMNRFLNQASPINDEGWVSTGDSVEVRDGRVFFCGRSDNRITIGGQKVFPEEVESALVKIPGIKDALVYERQSPIVGSLVAADVVVDESADLGILTIKQQLKELLPDYKVPHTIRRVDMIPIHASGKKVRHGR